LRIGLSITDIGWLTYKKGANSNNFILNGTTNLKEDFDNLDNSNGKISSHNQRINELIATNQAYQQGNETETFKTTLPMAISLQVDYHLWKGFYLNFTPFISLYQAHNVKDDFAKIHSYSIVSLAPRFEHKWFGISVPLQYNQMSERGFALGLGLRMGPLWIGTNDLLSLCSRDIYGMNLQAALKVPIMYNKKRDSDGDHISDRKDKCKAVSGVCQYQGCPVPDNDKDGVPDRDDECPQIRGIKALKGCPDSDGDGIADKDDECPDIVGLQQFNGCPDTDGDAIPDRLDSCPDEHGPADNNGCPKKAPIDYTGQILFKANKTSLVSSSYPLLDSLVSIINNNPEYYITVDGHTDSSGNSKSNIKLSQKRAEAIRDYLLKKEIAPERVIARGYGDTKPIVDNKTVESRAKNRRVEINLATPFIQEEKSTKFDIPTGGIFDTKDNQADSLSTAFNVPTGDIFDAKDNQADSLSTAFNIPTWYIFDTNDNPADSLSSKNVKTKIEAVIAQMENAIYFDSDKYELKKEAIKVLDKKIALLRKYPDMRVSLVAHNCTLIKDELNDLLSENQIEMARFYMISQGISSHRLTNVLIDKKFSTYPNTTEYNSNHNKCVGFIVME
jgi:outer membrane protein OmpA-like peptidoglycan-associated protein